MCYKDLKMLFTAMEPCRKRRYCNADHTHLQRAALRGMIRNIQIMPFILMSLGQPTPSTLSSEVMDGAVLGYPKAMSISRVLHPFLHHF